MDRRIIEGIEEHTELSLEHSYAHGRLIETEQTARGEKQASSNVISASGGPGKG